MAKKKIAKAVAKGPVKARAKAPAKPVAKAPAKQVGGKAAKDDAFSRLMGAGAAVGPRTSRPVTGPAQGPGPSGPSGPMMRGPSGPSGPVAPPLAPGKGKKRGLQGPDELMRRLYG